MKSVDHIAFHVDKPDDLARWYNAEHGAKILYISANWSMIQVKNLIVAFTAPAKHLLHNAFMVADLSQYGKHKKRPESLYSADPFGIII